VLELPVLFAGSNVLSRIGRGTSQQRGLTGLHWRGMCGSTRTPINESGFAHDMPRPRGYALKGRPCHGTHDWNPHRRTNVIGALVGNALLTVALFTTNINADVFNAWLIQDLLPKLDAPTVLVMDNARFHKRTDIGDALAGTEHCLEPLPAYSPDLNPIEQKWANAKPIQRKIGCPIKTLFKSHCK
jgi:transposase